MQRWLPDEDDGDAKRLGKGFPRTVGSQHWTVFPFRQCQAETVAERKTCGASLVSQKPGQQGGSTQPYAAHSAFASRRRPARKSSTVAPAFPAVSLRLSA